MCVACTVRLDGRRVLACLTIEELAGLTETSDETGWQMVRTVWRGGYCPR
jgi:hypothetical protein